MASASMIMSFIALGLNLLPLASAWFMMISWISWILVVLSIVFGVIAITKGQNVKAYVGVAVAILAAVLPFALAEYYVQSTIDSVGNIMNMMN